MKRQTAGEYLKERLGEGMYYIPDYKRRFLHRRTVRKKENDNKRESVRCWRFIHAFGKRLSRKLACVGRG